MGAYLRSDQERFHKISTQIKVDLEQENPRIPKSFLVIFFFMILSTGLVAYSRRQFNVVIQSQEMSKLHCIITDATGSIISAILLSIMAYLAYHNPIWKRGIVDTLWRYLFVGTIHTILFVIGSTVLRLLGFQLFGLQPIVSYDLQEVFQTEIPAQVFMLLVTVATMHGLLFFQRSNLEQLRLMQTEQELIKERLRSLQGQLNPHFLFNTLNTISAVMYEDASAADRMIERLSDLLRASFKLNSQVELTLREELALLNAYTSLMMDRFPNRFEVNVKVDDSLMDVLLPPLILQPIIENCFKHGKLDTKNDATSKGLIEVHIGSVDDILRIKILDNGQANSEKLSSTISDITSEQAHSHGLGLSVTKRRLKLLYGPQGSLEAGFKEDNSGYLVTMNIPVRRSNQIKQWSP